MIAGIFHQGSGLGNQLFRYVATRVLALDKGYEWGMIYNPDGSGKEEGFKGKSFFKGDFLGERVVHPKMKVWNEKRITENGIDIRSYDPEINFVEDNTIIDGEFQDERYFRHRMSEIDKWLKVELLKVPDDTCVIGFRGGEFSLYPDLFLTIDYWNEAIQMMRDKGITKFEVHTDDKPLAEAYFGNQFLVIHDVGINWRSMRYAKCAIIANSSFFILPRLLAQKEGPKVGCVTIAPRYWGRRNTKVWSLPQNYYKDFLYL